MKLLKIIPLLAIIPLLHGCLSDFFEPKDDPTVFYLMQARDGGKFSTLNSKTEINFQPVAIPSYMMRNQIVMLNSKDGNVNISEFKRWGEPPQSGIMRVLAEDIARADPNISIYAYPEISVAENPLVLRVAISECIGSLGGDLLFKGRWSIDRNFSSSDPKDVAMNEFTVRVPCGKDADSYVKAVNEAIFQLSQQIVKALPNYK